MAWLAAGLLVLVVLSGLEVLVGSTRIAKLAELPNVPSAAIGPRVSLVVAARNEGRNIETAVRSMLTQQYPDYDVVVVNDRSTDQTGAILDRLATEQPRLHVIHLTALPAGWLGKNHALHIGAQAASGEWILFTDADIHLHPDALGRAVRYCIDRGVDHLAAAPDITLPGFLLRGFGVFFLYSFLLFSKPWKARDPKSWFFVGVGAFNLVRRSAYLAVEGHQKIRLRPDDDLKLGKVLKRAGFRQDAVWGGGMIEVDWYHSLGEMIRGFEKNMFSGVEYSVLLSVGGGLLQLALGVLPVAMVFLTAGVAQALFAAQLVAGVLIFALVARMMDESASVALIAPVVVLLFVYILWRTMIVNLALGGIRWRDTFYPLSELRANRV